MDLFLVISLLQYPLMLAKRGKIIINSEANIDANYVDHKQIFEHSSSQ